MNLIARHLLFCFLALVPLARAQHDPHRNATQAIADGRLAKAGRLLEKADAADSETRFARMMLALAKDDLESAARHAGAALAAGLPFTRIQAGPREQLGKLHAAKAFPGLKEKYGRKASILVHGPMLGSVTDSSASFWIRTDGPADVRIRCAGQTSKPIFTAPQTDFTALAKLDGLKPASAHDYEVLLDGKSVPLEDTRFRTFPVHDKPAAFPVAFGGGAGFVPEWERMWDTIRSFHPLAMLMLGDNVYIDQPQHDLCQLYCYYRRQSRPEWRRLTASTAMFSIYDDHDFGTDDCIPGPEIDNPPWKRRVWNLYRQNWANPSYGGGENQPGCWYDFHIGDVHFIMLDGRYYRDLKGGSMLGPVQKAWFKQTLAASGGTFKVIVSPVPWTENVKPGSKDPWDGYPNEREEIFSFIDEHRIGGVFLVSADRHRTDLRTTGRTKGYTLHEFQSSRLTNRHTHKVVPSPDLVWGYNKTCSFGLIRFDTKQADPRATFECVSIDGKVIHTHTLLRSELETPAPAR